MLQTLHDWFWIAVENAILALIALYCLRRGLRELLK